MSSKSDRIKGTYRLPNKLYQAFHQKTEAQAQTKNGVIEKLVEEYVNGDCLSVEDGSKKGK